MYEEILRTCPDIREQETVRCILALEQPQISEESKTYCRDMLDLISKIERGE